MSSIKEKLIVKYKIGLSHTTQQKIKNIIESSINYFSDLKIEPQNVSREQSSMKILFRKSQHEKCISKLSYINKKKLKQIKLFDEEFYEHNHISYRLIYKNKNNKLKVNHIVKTETMIETFKLHVLNKISCLDYIFCDCTNLLSVKYISSFKNRKIVGIEGAFNQCNSLLSLPEEISNWDISHCPSLGCVFKDCSSLKNLPDISKWKTDNISNFNLLFKGCLILEKLPDISNWNTNKVINMTGVFCVCKSLESLPDISKWKTNEVKFMNGLFYEDISLSFLPDISKWNTQKLVSFGVFLFFNL